MNTRFLLLFFLCAAVPLAAMNAENTKRKKTEFPQDCDIADLTKSMGYLAVKESSDDENKEEVPVKKKRFSPVASGITMWLEGKYATKDPQIKRQFQKNRPFLDPEKTRAITIQGAAQLERCNGYCRVVVSTEREGIQSYLGYKILERDLPGYAILSGNAILLPPSGKDEKEFVLAHPYAVRRENGTVHVGDYKKPYGMFHYSIIIPRVDGDHFEHLGLNGKFVVVTQADGSTISWNHEKVLKIFRKKHG